ncbi:MAG: 30S ribosomal protein S2 [Chloroflexota bacterium]|nr:30S ribosomal protein S2 [Chloroflexota bacterium]
MPSQVTIKGLLETGVHFGHRTTKWNPKMKPYIFTERNGIHIIDLQQTIVNLNQYYDMIRDMAQTGGTALFVGTKRQAQEAVAGEADRCNMPYVNSRWLGGTLTNWRTIRDRIDALKKLEKRRENGEFDLLSKKEGLILSRKILKLQERLGGIRNMKKLPEMLIVVDTRREATAVKEANTLNIPVLALADTNSDPDTIDYIIPANDDAVRAVKLLLAALADAAIEGQQMRNSANADSAGSDNSAAFFEKYADDEESDEALLGPGALANLAKLKTTRLLDDTDSEA